MPARETSKHLDTQLQAARRDEARVYVESLIEAKDQSKLLLLDGEDAQIALDLLWKQLDKLGFSPGRSGSRRNKLRRLIIKLTTAYDKLPQALLLNNVQCSDVDARFSGGVSDIYRGQFDDRDVALKRLRVYLMFSGTSKAQLRQEFYREALIWRTLSHIHVLPLLGVTEEVFQHTLCMVLPWMENGTIIHHLHLLHSRGDLSGAAHASRLNSWIRQISLGLSYLHSEEIVHGDLRGNNILIDSDFNVKLTDFGMSRISETVQETYATMPGGAIRWQSPELLDPDLFNMDSSKPTCASDVYSFACTCVELIAMRTPFEGLNDYRVVVDIVKGKRPSRPTLPDGGMVSDELWTLVNFCWAQEPSARPSAKDVVRHMDAIVAKDRRSKPLPDRPPPSPPRLAPKPSSSPSKPRPAKLVKDPPSQTQVPSTSSLEALYFWRWFRRTHDS